MTLTDFLLARIAEDEAVASAAASDPLASIAAGMRADALKAEEDGGREAPALLWAASRIADRVAELRPRTLHDPARVLAECEAKRRIMEAFEDERVRRDIYNREYSSGEYDFNENDLRSRLASNAECRGLEIAMQAHAAIYADHPDYREEWKP